ncbi:MAG: LLM class flavin-dependent oxidoreductase [Micrococcales bacterium]|nr:LLM class flavin-dependent oxidoreductase [Micrococcales bacterium]
MFDAANTTVLSHRQPAKELRPASAPSSGPTANQPKRITIGTELSPAVSRYPSRIEDQDDERRAEAINLGGLARLARTAQRGLVDFVALDDTAMGNPPYSARRRGALDAVRLATRLAKATEGIQLLPAVNASRAEASSLVPALVELEVASEGRHAWELVLPELTPAAGQQSTEVLAATVEDTWSDSPALTATAASARALRQQRLGEAAGSAAFSAPPTLVMRANDDYAIGLAARQASVVRTQVVNKADAAKQRRDLRALAADAGRNPDDLKTLVDLSITLSTESGLAEARKDLAEEMTGVELGDGQARFVGHPDDLAEFCVDWVQDEACDGFTVRPTSLPIDLRLMVDMVIPALQTAGHIASTYSRSSPHLTAPRAVPVPQASAPLALSANPEDYWD